MLYLLLLFIIHVCSSTLDADIRLHSLIASTRGYRKKEMPEWRDVLTRADGLIQNFGYPESSRKVRWIRWYMLLMNTEIRDAEYVFRAFTLSGAILRFRVTTPEAAKSRLIACIDAAVTRFKEFTLTLSLLSRGEELEAIFRDSVKTAKSLKSIVSKTDMHKKSQRFSWREDYTTFADRLLASIEAVHDPLTGLTEVDMWDFLKGQEDLSATLALLDSVTAMSIKHHLELVLLDSALLRMFSCEYSVNLRGAIAMSYITDSLSSLTVGLLLAVGKLNDPNVRMVWDASKASNTEGKRLKSNVIMQHVGGDKEWVTDCKAWRREQLSQVALSFQLAAIL